MWYYYRPKQWLCEIAEEDLVRSEATVTLSEITTTGKFPEYHQVWKDNLFRAVAIFGKAQEDEESPWDGGVKGYQRFYGLVTRLLSENGISEPKIMPEILMEPTVDQDEVIIQVDLEGDMARLVA